MQTCAHPLTTVDVIHGLEDAVALVSAVLQGHSVLLVDKHKLFILTSFEGGAPFFFWKGDRGQPRYFSGLNSQVSYGTI